MPAIARLGDPTSHGGVITAGSPDVKSGGVPVARVGDTATCPLHGSAPIIAGSSSVFANGLPVARQGDALACGATIAMGNVPVQVGG